jgi:hypothetical protein
MISQGINLTQLTLAFYIIWLKQTSKRFKKNPQEIGFLTNNYSYWCKIG